MPTISATSAAGILWKYRSSTINRIRLRMPVIRVGTLSLGSPMTMS